MKMGKLVKRAELNILGALAIALFCGTHLPGILSALDDATSTDSTANTASAMAPYTADTATAPAPVTVMAAIPAQPASTTASTTPEAEMTASSSDASVPSTASAPAADNQ